MEEDRKILIYNKKNQIFEFKFEEKPISDYWYIQVLIFWGCLPSEIVYILGSSDFDLVLEADPVA